MKEPNVKQQIDEVEEQYKDQLITLAEYKEALDRISHHYDEYLNRNK